jgi:hypothetical protein
MAAASTKLNSSPFLRMMLGFLSPLFGLFDDYWFYIYHNNTWQNFTIFPDLLVLMYVVNEERIISDFFSFSDSITIDYFRHSNYFENYTNDRIMQIDQKIIYTALTFEAIIFRQFPFLIVGFILIKLFVLIIRKCFLNSKK